MLETEEKVTEQAQPILQAVPEELPQGALEQLLAQGAEQIQLQKKQLFFTRICAIAMAGILALAVIGAAIVMPRLTRVLSQVDTLTAEATQVMADLREVSDALSAANIGQILTNLDTLVTESQQGVSVALQDAGEALSTLKSIDIASLNKAITDLGNVVSPLSKLFGGGK